MRNQLPHPDRSTPENPSYAGRWEPHDGAWRAILIRYPDLAWFLIADGLDEKTAERYARWAALESDPPNEAALLRARHIGDLAARARGEQRRPESALSFGWLEDFSIGGPYWRAILDGEGWSGAAP